MARDHDEILVAAPDPGSLHDEHEHVLLLSRGTASNVIGLTTDDLVVLGREVMNRLAAIATAPTTKEA